MKHKCIHVLFFFRRKVDNALIIIYHISINIGQKTVKLGQCKSVDQNAWKSRENQGSSPQSNHGLHWQYTNRNALKTKWHSLWCWWGSASEIWCWWYCKNSRFGATSVCCLKCMNIEEESLVLPPVQPWVALEIIPIRPEQNNLGN